MALCTAVYRYQAKDYIVTAGGDPTSCAGPVLLSSSEYNDWLTGLTAFGFDQTLFEIAFGSGLVLFAIGLGIGVVISTVRKLRGP